MKQTFKAKTFKAKTFASATIAKHRATATVTVLAYPILLIGTTSRASVLLGTG